jgi:hypothetical protein
MRIAPDYSPVCASDSFADSAIAPDSSGTLALGLGAAADLFIAARAAEGASPKTVVWYHQHATTIIGAAQTPNSLRDTA